MYVGWSYPANVRKKLTDDLLAEKRALEHSQFELHSGGPDNRDRSLVIDEHLEEYNDYVWVKGYSKGKPRFPEMYDNQTDKPKQLFSVIDLIPYIPWYHSVHKMKFMADEQLPVADDDFVE